MQFPHRAQSAFMRLRSAPGGRSALRPFGPNALLATIPAVAAGTDASNVRLETVDESIVGFCFAVFCLRRFFDRMDMHS